MLNTKKLLAKIVKSLGVISSGNWKYLQIGSLFIGAYSATEQLTITTQVGQVYQTAGSSTITLPITLTSNLYSNLTGSDKTNQTTGESIGGSIASLYLLW